MENNLIINLKIKMETIKNQFLQEIESMFWFNLTNNEKNVEFDFGQYKLNRLYKPLINLYAKQFFDNLETDIKNEKERQKVIDTFIDFFSLYYNNWDFGYFKSKFNNYQYRVNYSWKDTEFFWATKDCYYVKTSDVVNEIELNTINTQTWLDIWEEKEDLKLRFSKKTKSSSEDKEKYDFSIEFNDLLDEEDEKIGYEIVFYNWEESKAWKPTKLKQIKEELKQKWIDYEKNTWLQNALDNFLKKWWRDYFIHKRLKEFLSEELEWYFFQVLKSDIQNKVEILELQNKINSLKEKYSDDKEYLDFQVAKLLKENNSDDKNLNIYTFSYAWIFNFINILSDLEELKKSIWLKKRKVIREDFCITLWRLDEIIKIDKQDIFNEIATNKKQVEEWKELLSKDLKHIRDISLDVILNEIKSLSFEKAKNIVVDSKHFDRDSEVYKRFVWMWKMELYEDNTNLDWILVKSENFQALNTLQDKYAWKVKTIYQDPPYNTWKDWFVYKDWFSHSTWLSLIENRLKLSKKFFADWGVLFSSIWRQEQEKMETILLDILPYKNIQDKLQISWQTAKWWWNKEKNWYENIFINFLNWIKEINSIKEWWYNNDYRPIFWKYWNILNNRNFLFCDEKKLIYIELNWWEKIYFDENYEKSLKSKVSEKYYNEIVRQYKKIDLNNWDKIEKNKVIKLEDNKDETSIKSFWKNFYNMLNSFFSENGKNHLYSIIWDNDFDTIKPEELLNTLFSLNISNDWIILDYFMWSWSTQATAHKMWRKYLWVELWNYFETIDIPRMKRVLEWEEWWISKNIDWKWTKWNWWWFFKYLYLNQYDDWFSDNWYLTKIESDIKSLENLKIEENKISDLLVRLKDIKEKIYNGDENL